MKIYIYGYSGSGKSTLAHYLADQFNIAPLYLDTVHRLPNWVERDQEDEYKIVDDFLNTHDEWVIDGNYTRLQRERRCKEANLIIFMNFNRYDCFKRAMKRYEDYIGKTRESMTEGCDEKFDFEFACWILWEGRSEEVIQRNFDTVEIYKEKTIVINNQKELDDFMSQF